MQDIDVDDKKSVAGVKYVIEGDENYKAMERRILRKCDLRIMPLICLSYLLNYLDRTNLGNARVLNNTAPDNFVVQLGLDGTKYNTVVAIFYASYVIFEFPSNIALKYFTPSKWIARIMLTWGIITCCTAAVQSYAGLIAVRVVLGMAEAGFFPGVICYLCFWYTPSERGKRMAIFSASVSVSGAFGGLLATGISFMHGLGNLAGWQWLFILEGIPAVLMGVIVWFYLPDYPETAKFLTPEEREFASKRMGKFAPKGTDKHFDKADFLATIKAWQFWVFAICYFFMTNSLNAFGFFAPSIVQALGFSGYSIQLMSVPPNVVGFFVIIGTSWSSDHFKERPRHIIAGLCLTALGYLLLAVTTNVPVRYLGLCFAACTNAGVIPFLAYRTATVTGATSTAIATGGVIAIANIAGITAPYLFPSSGGPRYLMGNWTVCAMLFSAAIIVAFLWYKLGASSEYRNAIDSATVGEEVDKSALHASVTRESR